MASKSSTQSSKSSSITVLRASVSFGLAVDG